MNNEFEKEVRSGKRFEFGKNWAHFLETLDETKIQQAKTGLLEMLPQNVIEQATFLDAGSGSGLSSLVARQLGAKVVSFDYDPQSVTCTRQLKKHYFSEDEHWTIHSGSVLEKDFLASLGQFDIVYSWGVLHHTGSMWEAIESVSKNVKENGLLHIMIYADRGWKSTIWTQIKRFYCSGKFGRYCTLGVFIPYYLLRGLFEDLLKLKNPLTRYQDYGGSSRGMSKYYDWIDWLGGYPFETANVDSLQPFLSRLGFSLIQQNEQQYVFKRH